MNKNFKKTNEKKTLRKVKKNWVVMAAATFALTGGLAVVQTETTASANETTTASANETTTASANETTTASANETTTAANQTTTDTSSDTQKESNTSSGTTQQVATRATATVDSTQPSQAAVSTAATTNRTNNVATDADVKATGKWGDVDVTLSNEGVLTLTGTGTLSKDFPGNISKQDVTKIVITQPVKLPSESGRLLGDFYNLKEFVGLSNVDASDLQDAAGLFVEDHNVESIDVSSWKTPKLSYAFEMFAGLHRVKTINVSGLDTSNVTSMEEMFSHDYNLTNIIGLNSLDVSKVNKFIYFVACDVLLPSLDISNFKTVINPDLLYMFYNTPSMQSINISGFANTGSGDTRSFDLVPANPNTLDDGYPNIDDSKSQLTSIVTGPNMDLSKMAFQSSVSDMNYYKLVNGQAVLNDLTKSASDNWVASVIKIVDRDHPDQVLSTLLFQGRPGSSVTVNIPDGYGLDPNSTKKITLGNQTTQDAEVKVFKSGSETGSSSSSSASSSASSAESGAASSATSSSVTSNQSSSSAESSASSSAQSSSSSSASSSSALNSATSSAQNSSASSSQASSSNSSAASNASSSATNSSSSSNGVIDEHKNNNGKSHKDTDKHQSKGHVNNANKHTQPTTDANNNHEVSLPQTGQRSTRAAQIFGLLLIILSLGLVALHRHDHHKK